MNVIKRWRAFERMTLTVLVVIFLVMLAGATVRASDSGMGCPDWPLCFGRLIPPLSADQLPDHYRHGMVVDGRTVTFNALNTWTEYINRLLGALLGVLLLIQAVWAGLIRRLIGRLVWVSFFLLLVVVAEAFLGAHVVASYLQPVMVTFHLALAIVLCAWQLWYVIILRLTRQPIIQPPKIKRPVHIVWFIVFVVTMLQMFLGTRLRESFDSPVWGHQAPPIPDWIENIGGLLVLHEVSAGLLMAGVAALSIGLWLSAIPGALKFAWLLPAVLAGQVLSGQLLQIMGLANWIKPVHLLGSTALFVFELLCFWLVLRPVKPRFSL